MPTPCKSVSYQVGRRQHGISLYSQYNLFLTFTAELSSKKEQRSFSHTNSQLPHQEAECLFQGVHPICQLLAAVLDTLESLEWHYCRWIGDTISDSLLDKRWPQRECRKIISPGPFCNFLAKRHSTSPSERHRILLKTIYWPGKKNNPQH